MKKLTIYGIIAVMILASLTITVNDTVKAEGGSYNIYVDDDADPGWYDDTHVQTIQQAINESSENDIIFVYNGTYVENIVIYKTITIVGENKNNTIIEGSGNDDVVFISADNVNLSGFKIQNGGSSESFPDYDSGIDIRSDFNTIADNIITSAFNGICLYGSNSNDISCNDITNNTYSGIALYDSSNNDILQNHLTNNYIAIGSYDKPDQDNIFEESNNNNIIGNNIKNNSNGMYLRKSNNNNISVNNIDKNIKLLSCNNNTIYKNNAESIIITGTSQNNTMINNALRAGLNLDFDIINLELFNNIVLGNTVHGKAIMYMVEESNIILDDETAVGQIYLINCDHITISDQTIACAQAILLFNTTDSIVKNNYLNEGDECKRIDMFNSDNNIISGNNISGGISLYNSHYNTIDDNEVINHLYGGIYVDSSDNNTVRKNTILNCEIGLLSLFSNNNLFYHNNFINNVLNAYDTGNNMWHNSILNEGNYWDNYTGTDNNGDGIGDAPYNISGGDNKDHYPLMEPYSPSVQTELEVSIQTGFGFSFNKISAKVENIGDSDANNVNLSISVEYGLFSKNKNIGVETSVLESGDASELLTLEGLRGFGMIKVTAEAKADNADTVNATASGWIIGRLIILKS